MDSPWTEITPVFLVICISVIDVWQGAVYDSHKTGSCYFGEGT